MRTLCLYNCIPLFFSFYLCASNLHAENRCKDTVGQFTSIEGDVEVQPESGGDWIAATIGFTLCESDTVRVDEKSRAAIQLINHAVLRLDQNTTLRLVNISDNIDEWALLDLGRGAIMAFSRAPWRVKVNTPLLIGLIKGTEFYVKVDSDQTQLGVFEGHVEVENGHGKITVDPGYKATARADTTAPQLQTVVHPRDAVQWSLYYPPILAGLDGRASPISIRSPAVLRKALELSGSGKPGKALEILDHIPQAGRDASYYLYRSAILLSVGRLDDARDAISGAFKQSHDSGLAYALLAIIEVVQNQVEQATKDAEHAVELDQSSAARIALSYAYQASFKLDAARDSLLKAVSEHTDDPLAWARLGELHLMQGDRRQARFAASKAIKLSPDSARAQLVFGFCALAEYRSGEAGSAFTTAIRLDSANPLAHLGLGLAKISEGELKAGRQELETAVALDTNSALLRSYLGKAYFTEKRSPLDATQYRIAKSLDPLDPTAYYYDGIRKQAENKPVEALRDLELSKERNDNRANYRSRLLLDQDRASRGTSLARVYKDLGFTTVGQREASASLEDSPTNASAHRFLSDAYQGIRRREIARVSELLQAQLLQDVNVNPIQPSLAETNLNIFTLGGAASPGFNEFTPLFGRNTAKVDVNGFGGSNNTFGGEGAVTALYDRFSFGAAGLHYQSDGWRNNNGLNQHLYDFFAQAAVTPELNIQAEFRHRESKEGDLTFNFDPGAYVADKEMNRKQDMARFGLRYSPAAGSNLLFSYIHSNLTQQGDQGTSQLDSTTTVSSSSLSQSNSNQFEGQYLYEGDHINAVVGFSHSQADENDNVKITFNDTASPPPREISDPSNDEIKSTRGYLYSRIKLPTSVTWTLGFSHDNYTAHLISESHFNPKFGLQWDVTKDFRLRAAWLRTLKPALVNNRTIEPTQVAGFNQLFDDINGTLSTRYGGGFDWHLTRDFFWGGEISWRQLKEPQPILERDFSEHVTFEDRKETFHNLYLYWTPTDRLALKAEFTYDLYRSQLGAATENGSLPVAVETFSVPLSAGYFDPSGWFTRVGGTFVHQKVRLADTALQSQGNDSFFLVDADIGYRFPKRWGLASIGVKNLFNTHFKYQDDSYREFRDEPSTGPYFPDRIIMGRVVLNF